MASISERFQFFWASCVPASSESDFLNIKAEARTMWTIWVNDGSSDGPSRRRRTRLLSPTHSTGGNDMEEQADWRLESDGNQGRENEIATGN